MAAMAYSLFKKALLQNSTLGDIDLDIFSLRKPPKDWYDSEINKLAFPDIVFDANLSDDALKSAVRSLYNPNKVDHEMFDVLLALVYNEFRANTSDRPRPRLFLENQNLLVDKDIQYKTEGSGFDLTTFEPCDVESENSEGGASSSITTNTKGVHNSRIVLPDMLSDDDRTYIGAWAFYHTRMIVQNEFTMLASQTKGGKNSMRVLIISLYDLQTGVRLPPFSQENYNFGNSILSKSITGKAFVVRANILATRLGEENKLIHERTIEAMKQLSLDILDNYALSTYNATKQAAEAACQSMDKILDLIWKEHLTSDSVLKTKKFLYKYVHHAEAYEKLSPEDKKKFGPRVESKYYRIARLIDTDYLSYIGRKSNEPLLAALYTIVKELTHRDTNPSKFGKDLTQDGIEHGKLVARHLKSSVPE